VGHESVIFAISVTLIKFLTRILASKFPGLTWIRGWCRTASTRLQYMMSTNWSSVWSLSGPTWSRAWSTRLLMNGTQGSRRVSCQGMTFWTFTSLTGFPRVLKNPEIWVWIFQDLKSPEIGQRCWKLLNLASVFLKNQVSDRVIFAV